MVKQRLDTLLVTRGLAENKIKAQAVIMAGAVSVNGNIMTKAGSLVPEDSQVQMAARMPYVSRGGLKLEHVLKEFKIVVKGLTCLDVGASTGGFTDCLLKNGANRVYALDVGYGQLDYGLRRDSRVVVMEKVNAHFPFDLPQKVDLAVMDLSFISVTRVIPNVLPHLNPPGDMIVLFKPQFEADKADVGRGGIVKDPAVHAATIANLIVWMNKNGLRLLNLTASPILGAEGNKEFLIYMRPLIYEIQ
ncbi:MAG: TlyA family RNA methyltransferase [Dehalococcoidia bacterium]|jgi:23S rRNA (cytidine1920-2'-O)/16S rRNA (cytidine1409-2'-O)-methyltransferase